MKIILTCSIGHIGEPLLEKLIDQGHSVMVISSNPERRKETSGLGAVPATGKLQDTSFLAYTFQWADVVYTMTPPANYFDHSLDLLQYYKELGNNFAEAVSQAGVK